MIKNQRRFFKTAWELYLKEELKKEFEKYSKHSADKLKENWKLGL